MDSLLSVVITGAGRGIGYQLAEVFAAAGDAHVWAVVRNPEPLKALVERYPCITPIKYDLTELLRQDHALPELIGKATDKIDILVNNAGKLINRPFGLIEAEDIRQLFDINYTVPAMLIRSLIPLLDKAKGHVVNISSMGGFQGSVKFKGLSHYSASKAALAVLTECLAAEYPDLRFNALALGAVQTEMFEDAFPGYKAPIKASQAAAFIADFARNGHQYFNGKILPVSLSTP